LEKNIPINKGNYSLDTCEREELFNRNRAFGVEDAYAENRAQWEELPRQCQVADYPLLVDLELSSLCNLNCPFCYTLADGFKEKVRATLMDFGLFKKVVDEISGKVFGIRLSLRGEPTIHPDFIEAVRYAKSKGVQEVSTLTNGSNLTSEFFTRAMEAGIDWITVSFDGLDVEYEKNRRPLKFEEMYQRLAEISRIKKCAGRVKPVIKIQSVWPAIERNPAEFYEKMALVSDLVAFNPIIDYSAQAAAQKIPYEKDFICPQLYQRLVVGADGRVLLCANDEQSEHIIGDARTQTIHDIWHGKPMNEVRQMHRQQDGFLQMPLCCKCYLPRCTREHAVQVSGRTVVVRNYR